MKVNKWIKMNAKITIIIDAKIGVVTKIKSNVHCAKQNYIKCDLV